MRAEVAKRVLPLVEETPSSAFSEPNRWGTGELEEARVRPELVVEVRYDKVQGNRFRHGTKLIRWRDDKDPADCTWRELRPPREPGARRDRVTPRLARARASRSAGAARARCATCPRIGSPASAIRAAHRLAP